MRRFGLKVFIPVVFVFSVLFIAVLVKSNVAVPWGAFVFPVGCVVVMLYNRARGRAEMRVRHMVFEVASVAGETIVTFSRFNNGGDPSAPMNDKALIRTEPNLGLKINGELKLEILPIWKSSEIDEFHRRVPGMVYCYAVIYAAPGVSQEEIGSWIKEYVAPMISQKFPTS